MHGAGQFLAQHLDLALHLAWVFGDGLLGAFGSQVVTLAPIAQVPNIHAKLARDRGRRLAAAFPMLHHRALELLVMPFCRPWFIRLILIHDWSFSDQRIGVHFFGGRAHRQEALRLTLTNGVMTGSNKREREFRRAGIWRCGEAKAASSDKTGMATSKMIREMGGRFAFI